MAKNIKYSVLGVMSGTSLDGLDLAICTFNKRNNWEFKIEKSETIRYTNYWKSTLVNLPFQNKELISKTDIEYGTFLGEKIITFLEGKKIDFIASHGHTIFHQPQNNYTLQIGDGKIIAKTTGITTINNFRSLDVSLNGQGAPLVPIGDFHLFPNYKYCINLGGFANISIKNKDTITAFDICPANIVMNELSKKLGSEYDTNGDFAKSGNLIQDLLSQLNALVFYQQKAPKSLGREWVEEFINPLLLTNYKSEDILHTFCEHIAIQIGKYLEDETALFAGGGVFNQYLMTRIQHYSTSEITIPNQEIIEYKEALIFAFLGVLRIRNEVNCLQSVTGAISDNCGGVIHQI
jgi:anhydro-N-acetylmuramic acid kinase